MLVHTDNADKMFNAKEPFKDLNANIMSKYLTSQQRGLLSRYDAKNTGCKSAQLHMQNV